MQVIAVFHSVTAPITWRTEQRELNTVVQRKCTSVANAKEQALQHTLICMTHYKSVGQLCVHIHMVSSSKKLFDSFPVSNVSTLVVLSVSGVPWIQCIGVHIVLLPVYWALFCRPPQSQRITIPLQTLPADKRALCIFMYKLAHLTRGTQKTIQQKRGFAPN